MPFCPRCGKYFESNYCPSCGTDLKIPSEQYVRLSEEENTERRGSSASRRSASSGSIGLGALAGFLLLVFLGFIPLVGALIAGFVAGLIAREPVAGQLLVSLQASSER